MTKLFDMGSWWYAVTLVVMMAMMNAVVNFVYIEMDYTRRFAAMHGGLHPDAYGHSVSNKCEGTTLVWTWAQADGKLIRERFENSEKCT